MVPRRRDRDSEDTRHHYAAVLHWLDLPDKEQSYGIGIVVLDSCGVCVSKKDLLAGLLRGLIHMNTIFPADLKVEIPVTQRLHMFLLRGLTVLSYNIT